MPVAWIIVVIYADINLKHLIADEEVRRGKTDNFPVFQLTETSPLLSKVPLDEEFGKQICVGE